MTNDWAVAMGSSRRGGKGEVCLVGGPAGGLVGDMAGGLVGGPEGGLVGGLVACCIR